MSRFALFLSLTTLPALAVLAPNVAEACGGTFCDGGGQPMPVDQTGEDILFIKDGSQIEAHVRIAYEGEAERFAWIIPLQSMPEFGIGSEPLFNALSLATAPDWQLVDEDDCPPESEDDGGWGFVPNPDGGGSGGGGPDILLEQTVGAFDVVVLQGGGAAEVVDWLDQNGYQQDPNALPILQEYLDADNLFAAFKLTSGADTGEIHPVVIRYEGDEPCVPLRLTAIAATDDMPVRAYFLGERRWVPSNYHHVRLNPFLVDLSANLPAGIFEVMTLAVDEAGGRAFVTDYSSLSNRVSQSGIYSDAWDEFAFEGASPVECIDLIDDQGLANHPLIASLLMDYLPPPEGVPATEFWNFIQAYIDEGADVSGWDGPAFAADLSERIVQPGFQAVQALDAWPMLTRLSTSISPWEMTIDPMFHERSGLPPVVNDPKILRHTYCNEDRDYTYADGRELCLPDDVAWPTFNGAPFAEVVEFFPAVGAPQIIVDNRTEIDMELHAWNQTHACGEQTGDDGGDDDGPDTNGVGGGDDDGRPDDDGPGIDDGAGPRGCGCDLGEDHKDEAPLYLTTLLGLSLLRRRSDAAKPQRLR